MTTTVGLLTDTLSAVPSGTASANADGGEQFASVFSGALAAPAPGGGATPATPAIPATPAASGDPAAAGNPATPATPASPAGAAHRRSGRAGHGDATDAQDTPTASTDQQSDTSAVLALLAPIQPTPVAAAPSGADLSSVASMQRGALGRPAGLDLDPGAATSGADPVAAGGSTGAVDDLAAGALPDHAVAVLQGTPSHALEHAHGRTLEHAVRGDDHAAPLAGTTAKTAGHATTGSTGTGDTSALDTATIDSATSTAALNGTASHAATSTAIDAATAAQSLVHAAPTAPTNPTAASTELPAPPARDIPDTQPALGAALGRLRSRGDGTHEISVALHPADLGQVELTATVRDGTLTVTVACADHAAHEAVRAALPTLHDELAGAGFTGVDVTLSGGGAQPDSRPAHEHQPWTPAERSTQAGDDAGGSADPTPRRRSIRDAALDRWL